MSIWNLSPDVAIHHMLIALRPRLFADNLCMQPAANLDELRRRAAKFMQLEELREFHNQARVEASGEKGKQEKECQGRPGSGRGDRRRDIRESRFARYTPDYQQGEDFRRGQVLNLFHHQGRPSALITPTKLVVVGIIRTVDTLPRSIMS